MNPEDLPASAIGLIAQGEQTAALSCSSACCREIAMGKGTIRVLISGSSSDGRMELFEFRVAPEQPGPGLHVHVNSDECFTLLEGSAWFQIGPAEHTLTGGQSIVVPRCVPHSWHVVGDQPLVMLVMFTPAIGMEAYFGELSALVSQAMTLPTPSQMETLWSKYDTRPATL